MQTQAFIPERLPMGSAKFTQQEFIQKLPFTKRKYFIDHPEELKKLKFKPEEVKKRISKEKPKERTYSARASVQPDQLHIYTVPDDGYNRTKRFTENQKNLLNNKVKGRMSDKAIKRVKSAIQWLLFRSKPKRVWNHQQQKSFFFRLNFITLTLPSTQVHSDSEIVSTCLSNFLNQCRTNPKFNDYIWRAESQENGNIHFHITTSTYFPKEQIQQWWNQSVNLLGYVDRFFLKHNHRNPPSTQIRKVKHVRKLAAYLSSYMAKNISYYPIGELRKIKGETVAVLYDGIYLKSFEEGNKESKIKVDTELYHKEEAYKKEGQIIGTLLSGYIRPVTCKLWSCNQAISKSKPMIVDHADIQWSAIRKIIQSNELKKIPGEYVDSYFGSIVKVSQKVAPGFYHDLSAHSKGEEINRRFSDDKILQYL